MIQSFSLWRKGPKISIEQEAGWTPVPLEKRKIQKNAQYIYINLPMYYQSFYLPTDEPEICFKRMLKFTLK